MNDATTIHQIQDLTREEVARIAPDAVAVFPTSSTEQHGPHLAVRVDALLVGEVVQRAMRRVATSRPVVLVPPLVFGASDHHRPWAGTLSLNLDTYMRVVRDVCESLSLNGFRRVLLMNGHGGNDAPNIVAARDVANRFDIRIDAYSYWNINRDALLALAPGEFGALPGHASDFETSCMLAVDPNSVRPDFESLIGAAMAATIDGETADFGIAGPAGKPTLGFSDDSSHANAEIGEAFLDRAGQSLAEYIDREFGG
ncbi:MAG TPA: creatininase family protein [Chloroflexota bacterium]|nr:creatininase family protein [Chloroflexota bacterium]